MCTVLKRMYPWPYLRSDFEFWKLRKKILGWRYATIRGFIRMNRSGTVSSALYTREIFFLRFTIFLRFYMRLMRFNIRFVTSTCVFFTVNAGQLQKVTSSAVHMRWLRWLRIECGLRWRENINSNLNQSRTYIKTFFNSIIILLNPKTHVFNDTDIIFQEYDDFNLSPNIKKGMIYI